VKKGAHRKERGAAFKLYAPPVLVGVIPPAFKWHMGVQARDVHKRIAVYVTNRGGPSYLVAAAVLPNTVEILDTRLVM
jgi:hypothetical protein